MTGLDTNVILRFLIDDDPVQSKMARNVFAQFREEEPGFVSLVVLAELSWVLTKSYGFDRNGVADIIEDLLSSTQLIVEKANIVHLALDVFQAGKEVGFADALIAEVCRDAGASRTLTFDRGAATERGMTLVG